MTSPAKHRRTPKKPAASVFSSRVPIAQMKNAKRYFATKQPAVAIARAIAMVSEAQEIADAMRDNGTLSDADFDLRLL